jgi:hypothetical protein
MKPEDQPTDKNSQGAQKNPKSKGFIREVGREVGKDLLRETGTTIKWAFGGAVVGAIFVGGLGFWKFGVTGLWIGAVAGALIGGAIGGWLYFSA